MGERGWDGSTETTNPALVNARAGSWPAVSG